MAKNPDVSLTALRLPAAEPMSDVRSPFGPTPSDEPEIVLTPEVLHLEEAAMIADLADQECRQERGDPSLYRQHGP